MNDFQFWGQQIVEHAMFLVLMTEEPAVRAQLQDLFAELQFSYRMGNMPAFLRALDQFMALKASMLSQLERGTWLGFAYPSLLHHMLKEEDYFKRRLRGPLTVGDELAFWTDERAGENDVAAQLIDPTEGTIIQMLKGEAAQFKALGAQPAGPATVRAAAEAAATMNRALAGMTPAKPLSAIAPQLKIHVMREGQRMIETLAQLPMARVA